MLQKFLTTRTVHAASKSRSSSLSNSFNPYMFQCLWRSLTLRGHLTHSLQPEPWFFLVTSSRESSNSWVQLFFFCFFVFLPECFSIHPASGIGDLESQVLLQMKHPWPESVKTIQAWVKPLTLQLFLFQLACTGIWQVCFWVTCSVLFVSCFLAVRHCWRKFQGPSSHTTLCLSRKHTLCWLDILY